MVYWFLVFGLNWLNSHVGERARYLLGLHGQIVISLCMLSSKIL